MTTVDPGGEPVLTPEEREILEAAEGRIVLFHLSGPMIFGVAQAIAREHAAMDRSGEILIVDLSDVSMLGTTVGLALENVIRDAHGAGKPVYVAGAWRFVQCNWGARHLVNAKEVPKPGKAKSDSLRF